MKMPPKTVFLSYRRVNIADARNVYYALMHQGFDVFLDYMSLDAGAFEPIILKEIRERAHFIVILKADVLNRCVEKDDWLRREIEQAIQAKRNIVPLVYPGFSWSAARPFLVGQWLPFLPQYNDLEVPDRFFDHAMQELRGKYLNCAPEDVVHPPELLQLLNTIDEINEVSTSVSRTGSLLADDWFDKALASDDLNEKIAHYSQAIRLRPDFAFAFNNRGWARKALRQFNAAISDFDQAIRLKPNLAKAYFNRGLTNIALGYEDAAIADFSLTIHIQPDYAKAYYHRGIARKSRQQLDAALEDFDVFIDLKADFVDAYWIRALIWEKMGNYARAIADMHRYLERGGTQVKGAQDTIQQWNRRI